MPQIGIADPRLNLYESADRIGGGPVGLDVSGPWVREAQVFHCCDGVHVDGYLVHWAPGSESSRARTANSGGTPRLLVLDVLLLWEEISMRFAGTSDF